MPADGWPSRRATCSPVTTARSRETGAAEVRGELRVTAPLVFGRRHVTPIVATFLDAHPGMRVELVFDDRPLKPHRGKDWRWPSGSDDFGDSSLIARAWGRYAGCLVASPGYLASRGKPRTPSDLAKHDVIFTSTRPGPFGVALPTQGSREGAPPEAPAGRERDRRHADRGEGGLRYRPAALVPGRLRPRLALTGSTPAEYEPPPLPVQLVTTSAQHLAPKVRAFLDHATRSFATLDVIRPWS